MMLEFAKLSDLDGINALAKQADDLHAQWSPEQGRVSGPAFSAQLFLELQEDRQLYVVREKERIAAYVRIRVQPIGSPYDNPVRKVLYLEEICVDASQRHRGIGTRIMEELKQMARHSGCVSICLSVYPQNDAARAFYEKSGFAISSINMRMAL